MCVCDCLSAEVPRGTDPPRASLAARDVRPAGARLRPQRPHVAGRWVAECGAQAPARDPREAPFGKLNEDLCVHFES